MKQSKKDLVEEVDQLRTQLAGCGVAAQGWSSGRNLAKRGSYGWSPAYQDVLDLRNKYEDLVKTPEERKESWASQAIRLMQDEITRGLIVPGSNENFLKLQMIKEVLDILERIPLEGR